MSSKQTAAGSTEMMEAVSDDALSLETTHSLRAVFEECAETFLEGHGELDDANRFELLHRMLGSRLCRRLGVFRLPSGFLLSVVMPVFNEVATLETMIARVRSVGIPCEIILVDDGSTDGTRELLEKVQEDADLRVVFHERNQGKGAALKTGFAHARGDVVVIQDADMEYDPRDFHFLLQPILEDRADVVYGSRFSNPNSGVSPWWHRAANQLITMLSNLSTQRSFTDVETCYKMVRRSVLEPIVETLHETRFGIEIELTAKLARQPGVRFAERPISYDRRGYDQGKKIGWRDGVWALWCILVY